MCNLYDPNNLLDNKDGTKRKIDPILTTEDVPFHVHQSYKKEGDTSMIKCAICGGIDFNVGIGDHYTAVRCVKCLYEVEVHSG